MPPPLPPSPPVNDDLNGEEDLKKAGAPTAAAAAELDELAKPEEPAAVGGRLRPLEKSPILYLRMSE